MADEKKDRPGLPGMPGQPALGPGSERNREYRKRDYHGAHGEDIRRPQPRGNEGEENPFTDQVLANLKGNRFSQNPKRVEEFGEEIPGQADRRPSTNRNPYNFVSLPLEGPRLDEPVEQEGHPGHSKWTGLRGRILFKLGARTPLFIPEGEARTKTEEERQKQACCFFRAKKGKGGAERYAIPGASLKGALRSMVEAVANDEFGVLDEAEHSHKIPYRRRVFQRGEVRGRASDGKGWEVKPESAPINGEDPDRRLFLLWWKVFRRSYWKGIPRATAAELPDSVVAVYRENLRHPHYREHYQQAVKLLEDYDKTNEKLKTEPDKHGELEKHKSDLEKKIYQALPPVADLLAGLGHIDKGEHIYYTLKNGKIDSFGKNVHYLWPAERSVKDLVGAYWPRKQKGLHSALGLADRIFGFAAQHKGGNSHPFQGKVRVRTGWGPPAAEHELEKQWGKEGEERTGEEAAWPLHTLPDEGVGKAVVVTLAPLSSPARPAKARPLYLVGQNEDLPASYSGKNTPEAKGRKFYWMQRAPEPEGIWKYHRRNRLHDKVKKQCPPPLTALLGAEFECEVEFENLSREELGALLFVLRGTGDGKHRIHLGKGRPRGMGVCEATGLKVEVVNEGRYKAWMPGDGLEREWSSTELDDAVQAFLTWAGAEEDTLPAYIQEFLALHRWPDEPSVRYYPLHFRDYGWLPKADMNPDVPNDGRWPKPMKRALECEDEKPQK